MTGVSRFISFVIGLIVLILLFVLIANRFNANRTTARANVTPTLAIPSPTVAPGQPTPTPTRGGFDFFGMFRRNSPTPTATPTLTLAQQMEQTTANLTTTPGVYTQGQTMGGTNQIPKTGAPTLLLPLASAGLALGMWLRKRV